MNDSNFNVSNKKPKTTSVFVPKGFALFRFRSYEFV